MTDYQISQINRYPVKGLAPEKLNAIELTVNHCLTGDRRYALTHANSEFNFEKPSWVERRNFLVVARSPKLATIQSSTSHCGQYLTLQAPNHGPVKIKFNSGTIDQQLNAMLSSLSGSSQQGPYQLVSLGEEKHLTDIPTNTISVMNTASLRDLESRLKLSLDPRRFRGNLWFNGATAWEENAWNGCTFSIGQATLKVTEPIIRCAAIDANTRTGRRDTNLNSDLDRITHHNYFGVLAEVTNGAQIKVGEQLIPPEA